MSLFREARKHPEAIWPKGFPTEAITGPPYTEARFAGLAVLPPPVFLDATGVRVGREEMDRFAAAVETTVVRPAFLDLWIEWADQDWKDIAVNASEHTHAGARVRYFRDPRAARAFGAEVSEYVSVVPLVRDPFGSQRLVATGSSLVPLVDGRLMPSDDGGYMTKSALSVTARQKAFGTPEKCAAAEAELLELHRSLVGVVFYVMALLNCRNVVAEPVEPPLPKHHRTRRAQKRGLEWHRLVIVPARLLKSGNPKIVPHGTGEPMTRAHLVRGHFKTFSPERPLLGRHAGTFWWAPMERGSKKIGVVLKDYELREDKKGATA